jgi:hypothetical protein
MDDGNLVGRYPAIVKSYDPVKRTCRVDIPGITSGGDVLTEAEIEYAIGDKSRTGKWETEIEILPEDTVWVDFIGGDPRYPVITGWRNPRAGNSVGWRRFHHANIELVADGILSTLSGNTKAVATVDYVIQAATIKIIGNIELSGGTLTHEGVNIGSTHIHSGVLPGPAPTGLPQ